MNDIKVHIKELKPELHSALEQTLAERWQEIGKRLQKDKVWSDRKKRDKITRLLNELDKLTTDDQ